LPVTVDELCTMYRWNWFQQHVYTAYLRPSPRGGLQHDGQWITSVLAHVKMNACLKCM